MDYRKPWEASDNLLGDRTIQNNQFTGDDGYNSMEPNPRCEIVSRQKFKNLWK